MEAVPDQQQRGRSAVERLQIIPPAFRSKALRVGPLVIEARDAAGLRRQRFRSAIPNCSGLGRNRPSHHRASKGHRAHLPPFHRC
jgi:hypothetical protein